MLATQDEPKKDVPVYCDADYMEYVEKEGYVYAKGNVLLKYENISMKADEAKLNRDTNEVEAKGHIFITEKEQEVYGDTANYNLEKQTGSVTNVDFYSKPWHFKGKYVDKPSEKQANLQNSEGTTCKYRDAPHYHIWSKKIYIEQGEKIEGWHNLLFIGPVPVFYLPYFYRSLKDSRSPLSIRVGYSGQEGYYVKATYSYFFALWAQGYVYFDYMTNKGWGFGLEPHYVFEDGKGEGYIYTYYIKEQDTKIARWRLDAEHRQTLSDDIYGTARFNYSSDENFSNEYYAVPTVLRAQRSYLAVTKTDPYYTVTTSWERGDSWDDQDKKYRKTYENLPEVSFMTSSRRLMDKVPLYFSYSSDFVNYYTISNDYHIRKLSNDPRLTHTYMLTPRASHTTSFGFHEVYRDLNDRDVDNMGFLHSYDVINTLRNQWSRSVETDLIHSFSQRLSKRRGDPPDGIDLNKLRGAFYYRYFDRLLINASTGYDFRSTDEFRARFDPVTMELRARLREHIDYYLSASYNIDTGKIDSLDTYITFGRYPGWVYTIGFNYQPVYDIFDIYSSIEIPVHTDVKLEAGIRYDTVNSILKEQTYGLVFNITDCWVLQASLIQQRDNTIFWFNLRLRGFPEQGLGTQQGAGRYEI